MVVCCEQNGDDKKNISKKSGDFDHHAGAKV
jgi:hypothetical protein